MFLSDAKRESNSLAGTGPRTTNSLKRGAVKGTENPSSSAICFAALRRFTKGFHDGFMLTLRFFRCRILLPREKIAIAAATSQGAQCAMPKTRMRRQIRDRSGGDRISWHRNVARDAILNPGRRNPATGGSLMEVTPPESKPGFA